jgi:hypothetical protein
VQRYEIPSWDVNSADSTSKILDCIYDSLGCKPRQSGKYSYESIPSFYLNDFYTVLCSCCTKMDCNGTSEVHKISFENFDPLDIDTFEIISFQKNSDFSEKLDGINISNPFVRNGTSMEVSISPTLTFDKDYIIKVEKQDYKILNFVVKKESCNKCFLTTETYETLERYQVNAAKKTPTNFRTIDIAK